MNKVRITAIRQTVYPDLMAKYENPIEHTCDVVEGQQWISVDGRCPEGMCPSAWYSMREFVESLARGEGNFYDGWMKNPMSAMISCNDGFRPFSFYIEVVNEIPKEKKDNLEEIFPIVDEAGTVVGKATRGECHNGSRLLHAVVHLHVFNARGDVYLQKRPEWKDIQPGKWDTAVGGHIDYGETPKQALRREVREELGITEFEPQFIGKYVFDSKRERELVYVNRTTYDGEIRPSKEELDGGRFWTMQEIREAIGQGVLTPNFESEFLRFFEYK